MMIMWFRKFLDKILIKILLISIILGAEQSRLLMANSNYDLAHHGDSTRMPSTNQMSSPYAATNKIAIKYIWPTFPIGFLILGTIANILSIIIVNINFFYKNILDL